MKEYLRNFWETPQELLGTSRRISWEYSRGISEKNDEEIPEENPENSSREISREVPKGTSRGTQTEISKSILAKNLYIIWISKGITRRILGWILEETSGKLPATISWRITEKYH